MLHLLDFRKQYPGGPVVLAIPEWQPAPGVHWVQGANGSGKTTLFRAISGLLPCAGEVWLPATTARPALEVRRDPVAFRRVVNYGEAEPVYPTFLAGDELARFVAEAKGAPPGQLDSLADALGVRAFWRQPMGTYSSGMLKKLSLVLAFLGEPRLILLDEPLITLDVAATRVVGELVAARHRAGVDFLLSSHQAFTEAGVPVTGRWQVRHQTLEPA